MQKRKIKKGKIMQIVIDIDKDTYKRIKGLVDADYFEHDINGFSQKAIANGTVLPEHGDLVDRSEIEVEEDVYNQTYIIHAPTILEATKG